MKNQLIQTYLLVYDIYDNQSSLKYQRLSNFKPKFSDQEIITIYLYGQLNEKFNHRQIYNFIQEYWIVWFPELPSDQVFNRHLNLLTDNFQVLFAHLLQTLHLKQGKVSEDYLIDSIFHGVRLHLIAKKQRGSLPLPAQVWLKEGNIHDLTAMREKIDELPTFINLFGDKVDADKDFKIELQNQQIKLFTPVKKPKKQVVVYFCVAK